MMEAICYHEGIHEDYITKGGERSVKPPHCQRRLYMERDSHDQEMGMRTKTPKHEGLFKNAFLHLK